MKQLILFAINSRSPLFAKLEVGLAKLENLPYVEKVRVRRKRVFRAFWEPEEIPASVISINKVFNEVNADSFLLVWLSHDSKAVFDVVKQEVEELLTA